MSGYPYDSDVRQTIARLLYQALPAMYRVSDDPDMGQRGRGELATLLEILAAPLAVIRQNIEELHADLFIDSANDWVLPYLARMVGTDLVFPDAAANRLDIRGTVAWRRRKGTPAMLEDMGGDLTDQLVVTQEGWKRVMLAQDLNLLREERVVPDCRAPVLAEQADGPLDATWHAVDVRGISAHTGRYHPRQVYHWVHPTRTWPLGEGVPAEVYRVPGSDLRYSFHPLGEVHALRARRVSASDTLRTDRVPPLHYASAPGDWFGQEGRFGVSICGLLAAVPSPDTAQRAASDQLAHEAIARSGVALRLLDLDGRRLRGTVTLSVGLAPVVDGVDTWTVDVSGFVPVAEVEIAASGLTDVPVAPATLPAEPRVVLLRLAPPMGVSGRIFPGGTLMLEGADEEAALAHDAAELARGGFLKGGLFVALPGGEIVGERWLVLAGDGSVYDAMEESGGAVPAEHPLDGGARTLAEARLAVAGPGAAWPTLDAASEPIWVSRVPSAPGRGPALMHGGATRVELSGSVVAAPVGTRCALAFAARFAALGQVNYVPFQRLTWRSGVPGSEAWSALDADGAPLAPEDLRSRYAAIAALRADGADEIALSVRFECEAEGVTLAPSEVAWSTDDGQSLLIHLPQATSAALAGSWAAAADLPFSGEPSRVGQDGSTWDADSTAVNRRAYGAVAPLTDAVPLLRRSPRWRRLCAWRAEDWGALPPLTVALTESGRLDVDVDHGLFAMSSDDPPQAWPPDADGVAPPSVTVSLEEGATAHVGALPAAREPVLNSRLETPTRVVTGSGRLHDDAPASLHLIERYRTLSAALAAIQAKWAALDASAVTGLEDGEKLLLSEVIQIEDSSTYEDEALVWPDAPADPTVAAAATLSLTVQAAERERPVLLVDPALGMSGPSTGTSYANLTLRGLTFGAEGWTGGLLPPAEAVTLQMCTVLFPENELRFGDPASGAEVTVERCVTGGLNLTGVGALSVSDSVVDAGRGNPALTAATGSVMLDRVTVGGTVSARVLEASEAIFTEDVNVADRFQGCVRYSRVTSDSVLPRTYRVTIDTPLRFVSTNRHDPAFRRLHERCDALVRRGAENGSEMGAFSETHLAQRYEAFTRRLNEYTPAGLVTGIIRRD